MFVRSGLVVEMATLPGGRRQLEIVTSSAFRSRIEKYGDVFAWRFSERHGLVLKPTVCLDETAQALLDSEETRSLLPPIANVVDCPVLAEVDGELRTLRAGYNPQNGGVFVTGGAEPPDVPLCEAVNELKGILSEFDFQTPSDRSRAIAALLTPALRLGGHIRGHVPVDVSEADQSQTGKTFRHRLVAAIYNEVPDLIAARKGGVGSVDESFSRALITGKPFIQLDNFRGKLESQLVEAFLTATGVFLARVPHRGEVPVDPTKVLMQMTSNGVQTTRDFANRACVTRIRKRAGHVFRVFPEGNLLAHIQANQARYLGCVFSVVREWHRRGKPVTDTTEHDFREWARALDWIVQNLFQAAPLLEGHALAQNRVSDVALSFARDVALAVRRTGRLGQTLAASQIADLCDEFGIEIPGLHPSNEGKAHMRIGKLLGRLFAEAADATGNPQAPVAVEVEGFQITRTASRSPRPEGGTYTAFAYCFEENI